MGWRGGSRSWMVYAAMVLGAAGLAALIAAFARGTTNAVLNDGCGNRFTVSAAPIWLWLVAIGALITAWIFVLVARSVQRYIAASTTLLVWTLGCAGVISILAFGGGQAGRIVGTGHCIEAPSRSTHRPNQRDDFSYTEKSSRWLALRAGQSGTALNRASVSRWPWSASIGSRTSP